jgi:hypothetical protein
MININVLILHIVCIIHIFVWIYVLFGGFISETQNDFILYIGLPTIFFVQLLPFHILNETKYMLVDNTKNNTDEYNNIEYKDINNLSIDDKHNLCVENGFKNNNKKTIQLLKDTLNLYLLPKYIENLRYMCKYSFQNPFSAQGLIIISFIINVYLHKYKYHQ